MSSPPSFRAARVRVAVLYPGAMGTSVGAALRSAGHTVYWVAGGRTEATRARAERAGLVRLDALEALPATVDCVVSVCPPEAATELALRVLATGFRGTYLDANAVSPATARAIHERVSDAGGEFVDGGIVGPPAWRNGTTRLFLSGRDAARVVRWFESTPLESVLLGAAPGAASALKMCYAAYTKGSAALLLAIRALAEKERVVDALATEWHRSQPGLAERVEASAAGTAPKAWRFAGEMEEIARTFEDAHLPGGFHRGAAELYRQLAGFKDKDGVTVEDVIRALVQRSPERRET